jgi:hypothetical protein
MVPHSCGQAAAGARTIDGLHRLPLLGADRVRAGLGPMLSLAVYPPPLHRFDA